MGSEAEGQVAVGSAIEDDCLRLVELALVVVSGQPADDDAVVAVQLLAPTVTSRVTVRLSCWLTEK
ncbi:hypothetical protein BZL30_5596 [Mycobacterium kansasii]|uniref:Uncharacterized protein n=1 Tax=Mycobacterium kansasii TaxID=1768 RepID=A0A1V3X050_MYCKA|nr:hypothetical protein BZL30_5596 [Mycobacterium kansasii]